MGGSCFWVNEKCAAPERNSLSKSVQPGAPIDVPKAKASGRNGLGALLGCERVSCRRRFYQLYVRFKFCQQPANALPEVETVQDADNPSTDGALDEDDRKLGQQWLLDLDFKLMFPTLDARWCSHRTPPPTYMGQKVCAASAPPTTQK